MEDIIDPKRWKTLTVSIFEPRLDIVAVKRALQSPIAQQFANLFKVLEMLSCRILRSPLSSN